MGDCPPISLSSYKPTQVSQETLLNVLEKPCPRDYFVGCENTSPVYVPSISEDASFSNSTNELSEQSNVQDNRRDITKPADDSDDVADNVSTSTQTAKDEEEVEEEKVEEEKDDENKEKVEEDEDEIEDGRRKEMHFELLEQIACTEKKSVTLDCTKHLPEDDFSHCVDEPSTLDDNEPTAHSAFISELSCIDDDQVPYVPSCSSESSGYVRHLTWNLGKQPC